MLKNKLLDKHCLPYFHDFSKKSTYFKLAEALERASTDPSMIEDAKDFVHKYMLSDPHQYEYGKRWIEILKLPVDEIAQVLLADTPEGDLLRDTAPVFGKGFSSKEIADIMDKHCAK